MENENERLVETIEKSPTASDLVDDLQSELLSVKLKVSELQDQLDKSLETKEADHKIKIGHLELATAMEYKTDIDDEANESQLDEELVMDPVVEVEEELVLYKEKLVSLTQTNIALQIKIEVLQKEYSMARKQSMLNMLMYIVPILLAILGYFFVFK